MAFTNVWCPSNWAAGHDTAGGSLHRAFAGLKCYNTCITRWWPALGQEICVPTVARNSSLLDHGAGGGAEMLGRVWWMLAWMNGTPASLVKCLDRGKRPSDWLLLRRGFWAGTLKMKCGEDRSFLPLVSPVSGGRPECSRAFRARRPWDCLARSQTPRLCAQKAGQHAVLCNLAQPGTGKHQQAEGLRNRTQAVGQWTTTRRKGEHTRRRTPVHTDCRRCLELAWERQASWIITLWSPAYHKGWHVFKWEEGFQVHPWTKVAVGGCGWLWVFAFGCFKGNGLWGRSLLFFQKLYKVWINYLFPFLPNLCFQSLLAVHSRTPSGWMVTHREGIRISKFSQLGGGGNGVSLHNGHKTFLGE